MYGSRPTTCEPSVTRPLQRIRAEAVVAPLRRRGPAPKRRGRGRGHHPRQARIRRDDPSAAPRHLGRQAGSLAPEQPIRHPRRIRPCTSRPSRGRAGERISNRWPAVYKKYAVSKGSSIAPASPLARSATTIMCFTYRAWTLKVPGNCRSITAALDKRCGSRSPSRFGPGHRPHRLVGIGAGTRLAGPARIYFP